MNQTFLKPFHIYSLIAILGISMEFTLLMEPLEPPSAEQASGLQEETAKLKKETQEHPGLKDAPAEIPKESPKEIIARWEALQEKTAAHSAQCIAEARDQARVRTIITGILNFFLTIGALVLAWLAWNRQAIGIRVRDEVSLRGLLNLDPAVAHREGKLEQIRGLLGLLRYGIAFALHLARQLKAHAKAACTEDIASLEEIYKALLVMNGRLATCLVEAVDPFATELTEIGRARQALLDEERRTKDIIGRRDALERQAAELKRTVDERVRQAGSLRREVAGLEKKVAGVREQELAVGAREQAVLERERTVGSREREVEGRTAKLVLLIDEHRGLVDEIRIGCELSGEQLLAFMADRPALASRIARWALNGKSGRRTKPSGTVVENH